MLTNFTTMSTERIQGMLKYAPGYDRSVDQLTGFLQSAQVEGLVDFKDGSWKLVR